MGRPWDVSTNLAGKITPVCVCRTDICVSLGEHSLKVSTGGKLAFKRNKVKSCSAASHAEKQQELSLKQLTPDR